MTTQTPHDSGRLEKILAYMVAGVVGVSILSFLAVILGTAAGVGDNDGFSQGVWPAVLTLPLFGLPLGFLLIIALMIISGLRRAREARQKPE
ncbi:hypothetical protein K2F54_09945 [Cryobacterium sp. 1639]|uniref:hypothetical protein n=1 Tax=Cryobacterium inferilacus TaxID=2866629 RepID=UPI001C72E9FB|nr:hypothetical protein [Cryobacterium sp. 1639]MBX0300296.1 hypothetical protein [Cryobacterium sp. 1639]